MLLQTENTLEADIAYELAALLSENDIIQNRRSVGILEHIFTL